MSDADHPAQEEQLMDNAAEVVAVEARAPLAITAKGHPDQVVFDVLTQFKQAAARDPERRADLVQARDATCREVRTVQREHPEDHVEVEVTVTLLEGAIEGDGGEHYRLEGYVSNIPGPKAA